VSMHIHTLTRAVRTHIRMHTRTAHTHTHSCRRVLAALRASTRAWRRAVRRAEMHTDLCVWGDHSRINTLPLQRKASQFITPPPPPRAPARTERRTHRRHLLRDARRVDARARPVREQCRRDERHLAHCGTRVNVRSCTPRAHKHNVSTRTCARHTTCLEGVRASVRRVWTQSTGLRAAAWSVVHTVRRNAT
jgi:hypothetical protein